MTDKKKKNPYGYDIVDEVGGGDRFLSFKRGDKGKVIQLRLVSEPTYVNQHWITMEDGRDKPADCQGEKCAYCGEDVKTKDKIQKTAKWGWIVIDREDGMVKLFTGPTLIARKIKELSELKDKKTDKLIWGDPFLYDLQVERTEEPGKAFYGVNPMPEGMGKDITAEEKKAVKKADIKLKEEIIGSKKSDNTGNYGSKDLETAPDDPTVESEKAEEVSDDDSIPF